MSTLNVTNLAGPSSTGTAATLSSINGGPISGARNRIINGDMRIDQRNGGAALNNAADGSWAVDRWVRYQNVGTSNIGRNLNGIAPPSGFTNYLGIQITTAGTASAAQYTNFQYYVEGFNAADLAWGTANAQPVTISFWVRSSLTGTQGFALQNGSSALGYPFTVTISAANTWEYKSVTIPGPTSGTWDTANGRGITLIVDLGMGSNFRFTPGSWQSANVQGATGALNLNQTLNATFYITGVQLEAGTVATPFERRSYGQELALCQRYYQIAVAAFTGYTQNGFGYGTFTPFQVRMRTSPTCSFSASLAATNFPSTAGNFQYAFGEGFLYEKVASATSGARFTDSLTASAEL